MKFEERNVLENKEALIEQKKLIREVIAFLNYDKGGTIFLGIDNDENIVGIEDYDSAQLQIKNWIRDTIRPNALEFVDIILEEIEGKHIIKIVVKSGIRKPYYLAFKGRTPDGCFIRTANGLEPMDEDMIERALENSYVPPVSMFTMQSPKNNLTFNEFKSMLTLKGIHFNDETLFDNFFLKNKQGELNYIAYLLSDQNDTSIKVCKFKGLDKTEFISRKEFDDGCLLRKMEQALEYVDNVINLIQTEIKGGRNRVDTPLFDMNSFKEAWLNAVCHNLWIEKIPPAIYAFDDRIEIISQGTLRKDLSIDDFYNGVSKPVNEEFASIFLKMHYMEQSGKGTSTIVNRYGKDVFKFGTSFIQCILPYEIVDIDKYNQLIGKSFSDTQNDTQNDTQKLLEEKIIAYIRLNGKITREQLALKIGVSKATITRAIKKSSRINYVGPSKGGHWEIVDKD